MGYRLSDKASAFRVRDYIVFIIRALQSMCDKIFAPFILAEWASQGVLPETILPSLGRFL